MASCSLGLSPGSQIRMIGSSGRSRRSQRKMWKPSVSPRGKSSRSKSGVTPDWIRSIAPQPLAALSSCHEFESAIAQSGRRTADSRLTTSTFAVSIAFFATGLVAPWKDMRELEKRKTLDRFDVVPFDAYRERSLNRIKGYD